MELFQKKPTGATALKYLFSYLIIFTVLIVGFFLILRQQITDNYTDYRSEQAQTQLDSMAAQFAENLIYLSQVDACLASDLELIEGRYKEANGYNYQALTELREYASTNKLINSIVYLPKKTGHPLSTLLPVSFRDGVFQITNSSFKTVGFDPAPYLDARSGQLIYVSNEASQQLIYFPSISARANYIFFYLLDTQDLQQQLKSITSEEMPAIALIDSAGQMMVSVNAAALTPCMDLLPEDNGVFRVGDSHSVCIHREPGRGFSIVSLLSHDFLSRQINTSFASSYLALLLLSLIGFSLVLIAMRITYLPLHRLTQKIIPDADVKQGYLNQLESAFTEAESQNHKLKEKLENYRLSMQKSLLDTIAAVHHPDAAVSLDIDQLFDATARNMLYIVSMSDPSASCRWETIRQRLVGYLPENGTCFLLEAREDSAVLLINYTGPATGKDERLKQMCRQLYEEYGCHAAISNGSDSPLDIPALYENAMYAHSVLPHESVAEFKSLPPAEAAFAYPHETLNRLSDLLSGNDFPAARLMVNDLFELMDLYVTKNGTLTNFFVQCVLIDVLTILTNFMNLSYIKFNDYCDLYFETLYFCRSCPYTEKAADIHHNIDQLIAFCEQTISEKSITSAPLIAVIEECYCQPDFSISMLADKFHVSIAYMSHLFKKELNVNFSDYLWMMRQKKAQELLRTTDISIDEISLAVGYVNTSSFRRKFKQETGVTPSQYRSSLTGDEPTAE